MDSTRSATKSIRFTLAAIVLSLIAGVANAANICDPSLGAECVKVGAASDAARFTPYDDAGNSMAPAELARGAVNILVRQTATTGAGACVFGIRNSGATRTIQILGLQYTMSFDGTGAASLMRYEWVKGTSVSAFSGGVAVTPSIFKTSLTQGTHVDARVLDTGLTTTGLAVGAAIYTSNWARLTFSATQAGGISAQHRLDFISSWGGPLELAQNEILCLRNGPTNASVVGDTVLGSVLFIEKAN